MKPRRFVPPHIPTVRGRALQRFVLTLHAAAVVGACQIVSGVADSNVVPATDAGSGPTADTGGGTTGSGEAGAFDAGTDGEGDAAKDATADAVADAGRTATLTVLVTRMPGASVTSIAVVGGATLCTGDACNGSVVANVPLGATLAVKAATNAQNVAHWRAPESCKQSPLEDCSVTMDGPKNLSLQVTANNYVFVTSATFDGNLGGTAGADAKCAAAATTAKLPGTYIAWLATGGATAASRLSGHRGWIRPDGKPFADTFTAPGIASGKVVYPIEIDENGTRNTRVNTFVYTGALPDGTTGTDAFHCAGWTTNTAGTPVLGSQHAGTYGWTNDRLGACSDLAHLYCFGTSLDAPITFPTLPAVRRLAFLSSGTLPMSTGIDAADALCDADKTTFALPGTYRAWLATSGASANSRFNLGANLGGWYRPDGMPVFPDPAVLDTATAYPTTPMVQFGGGSYLSTAQEADVWTGMSNGSNGLTLNPSVGSCSNWMSSASSGMSASAYWVTNPSINYALASCTKAKRVYCLQQ